MIYPRMGKCVGLFSPFILTIIFMGHACAYFSQFGQDEFLHKYVFKDKRIGFFVDIGAHDGISYSNTYFLEKELGWHGICIEPQKIQFLKLQKNRSAACLQCCIFDTDGETEFLQAEGEGIVNMFSGIAGTYPQEQLAILDNEIKHANGKINKIRMKTRSLNSICREHKINHIDLLAIDTEGSEKKIIEAIDFEKISIDVIVVENNDVNDNSIKKYLNEHGYIHIKRLWIDDVFCVKSFLKF